MSADGDRQSVLHVTKVRTTRKIDNSWIRQRNEAGPEGEEDEKPWITEVRARRVNSEFSDPVDDDTPAEPAPLPSSTTDRGVFTKTDNKPAASSSNGYIGTSGYTKKATEGYKKIAPHTIRTNVERTQPSESSLSAEEQTRRTEAASSTLNSSARKQRSYVLSAAKKYELAPGTTDSSASSSTAFVAKRVVINDDEDVGSSVEMSVDEPSPPASSSRAKPEPKKSDTLSALSDTLLSNPGSTSKKPVAQVTPPVSETKKVSKPDPNPKTSINETITQAATVAPVAALKSPATTKPKTDSTPKASNPKPVEKSSALTDNDLLDLSQSTPQNLVDPTLTTTELQSGGSLPKTDKTKGSLDLLAVDVIPIDTNTDKLSSDKTNTKIEITKTVVKTKTDIKSTPQKLVDPIPTTDLLSGGSLPKTEKTKGSLDLLAFDVIPIDTNTDKLSSDKTNTKVEITQTVVKTKTDIKSTPQKLVDPIPTTTDLLSGGSLPQTKKTTESLDLLAYDVIPIDTNKDRLSTDKTHGKVETTTTVIQTKTVVKGSADPFDPIPIGRESTKSSAELFDSLLSDSNKGQQKTVTVTYEQKSSKSSSPWDKWSVPTVDTVEDSEPDPEPEPTDDYTAYTRTEESSFGDLDTKAKKNLVYVKSYVNSSAPPRYSSSTYDNDYDYVTSSSSSYSYSSPSSTASKSTCTYCGGLVGNDSKITIDHLNIVCHPECFKCSICSKPMGDFIHSMFLHRGMVHCETCYSNVI